MKYSASIKAAPSIPISANTIAVLTHLAYDGRILRNRDDGLLLQNWARAGSEWEIGVRHPLGASCRLAYTDWVAIECSNRFSSPDDRQPVRGSGRLQAT